MTSRVCFHKDALAAEMMRSFLERNGLHPLPLSLTAAIKAMDGVGGHDIEVPDQEAAQARKLLSDHHYARQFVISD
jgi:hypothetical protein